MFKKNERLSRPEFTAYFAKGTRHHFTHCTIITSPLATRKVSVVVGKKVAKSAVRRNSLKRRIYAQLRIVSDDIHFTGVLIIIAKPSYNALSRKSGNQALQLAVTTIYKKLST